MATIRNISVKILKDTVDHKGMPLEVELEYAGVKHVIPADQIETVLGLYLYYERIDMTPQELIDKVRELDKVEEKVEKKEETKKEETKKEDTSETKKTETTTSTTETHVEETRTTEEESKPKVTSVGKTILALVTAGVVLVTGHIIGSNIVQSLRRNNQNNGEDNLDFGNTPAIEQQITEVPIETTFTTPAPDNIIAPPLSIDGSENLPYINGSTTDWISMSDAEYLEALNSQTIACQMNMPEISLFLEGEPLEGTKQLTDIQKTFKPRSVEYCIVEYFNQFRNEVVNAAYDTQNVETTRTVLEHHATEIYLFCTGRMSIALNTDYGVHEYYWNDLSEEAKNAVLDVLFSFAIALPHDYAIYNDNGTIIYPVTLAEFYEAQLANLILVNPTNRR